MNKVYEEVQSIKQSYRCGYPSAGTIQESNIGLKLYTNTGFFFSSNENIRELATKKGIEGF